MRFLIVDSNYPGFLEGIYREHPQLESAPYADQMAHIEEGLFGEAHFQAAALRALGHEADVVIANAHDAQQAWAIEHGFKLGGRPRRRLRMRRGFVPWLSTPQRETDWETVLAQVAAARPDVVYVGVMDSIPPEAAARLGELTRFTVAQIAAPIPERAYRAYDLLLSSIPDMVDTHRAAGGAAAWVPLAFEPTVRDRVGTAERDIAVSFVGSLAAGYPDRVPVLEAVSRVGGLQTWTANTSDLPGSSPITPTIKGTAFGRDMYKVLGRSVITLNSHAVWAGQHANNLRLYEATGMGALLVTDDRQNLRSLFSVGTEVVAYRRPEEAAELVGYLLDHPAEASAIALAGSARTLRDHTWDQRMGQVAELVAGRL